MHVSMQWQDSSDKEMMIISTDLGPSLLICFDKEAWRPLCTGPRGQASD